MHPIFELLEKNGFIQDQDCLRVGEMAPDSLSRFYEEVYSAIFKNQYSQTAPDVVDPFNYLASASMRGDSTCRSFDCRINKIDFLNRYSALYASEIAVPLPLANPEVIATDPKSAAFDLTSSLLSLLRSRPLIDARVMIPTVMTTLHCAEHGEDTRQLIDAAQNYSFELAQNYQNEFEAVYQSPEKSPSGLSTIYLSGPTDFLDHGMVYLFDESASWRLKSWRFDREGKVKLRGPRKLQWVSRIFSEIASNTSYFMAYGLQRHARFLTDLAGETLLLEDAAGDHVSVAENSRAMQMLTHALPLLDDLSIPALLRLRAEDRTSFAAYRHEMNLIAKDALANDLSPIGAQELFQSKLLPAINQIQCELETERSKRNRTMAIGGLSVAASVAFGAFSLPLLTVIPLAATAAAVGARLLGEAAKRGAESKPEVRRNELYFLVRALQAN